MYAATVSQANNAPLIAALEALYRGATGEDPPEPKPESPPPAYVECTDPDGRTHEQLIDTWIGPDGRFWVPEHLPERSLEPAMKGGRADAVEMAHSLARAWIGGHSYTPGRGWYHRQPGRLWMGDAEALVLRERISAAVETNTMKGARTRLVAGELEPLLAYRGEWDADPALAGLPDDRVIDLATGHIRDAQPEDRISRRLGAVPTDGTPTRWLEVVGHVCQSDAERVWFQRWCGYTITGDTREHLFAFLHGPGGGGKTTIIETMRKIAGSYAAGIPEDVFVDGASRHREWLARLAGARMAVVSDLPSGSWRNVGMLKSLVAGDVMTANLMRSASFDFRPVAKLWLSGNAKPRLGRSDSGFERRLVLVPVAKAPHPDKQLGQALDNELPAITGWCVEGAAAYLRDGLPAVPERWSAAADAYHRAEDTIGLWFAERCQLDHSAFTPARELVGDYKTHTGQRLSRATPIYEWLHDKAFDDVARARMRVNGSDNPVDGVRGVRLCASCA